MTPDPRHKRHDKIRDKPLVPTPPPPERDPSRPPPLIRPPRDPFCRHVYTFIGTMRGAPQDQQDAFLSHVQQDMPDRYGEFLRHVGDPRAPATS
jgi:hypothetical protein